MYKHFFALTSQLPFCSTPIRLDSFTQCQFSCGYCFAKARLGHGREAKLDTGSPSALAARLKRVQQGEIHSALDEFIDQKVPIQFGGMADPFIAAEKKLSVSREMLNILRDFGHPYLISTKSTLVAENSYAEILAESSVMVRFSLTGIDNKFRSKVDKGTPSRASIFHTIEVLASMGIRVGIRIQPIFPEHESAVLEIIGSAARAGARHVSFEYLKLPLEANSSFGKEITEVLGQSPIQAFQRIGSELRGREHILSSAYRIPHLLYLAKEAQNAGLTVGLADNDLLHLSQGHSCCNGVDLHLENSRPFAGNTLGLLSRSKAGELLQFSQYDQFWLPSHNISHYFNSKSRLAAKDWRSYLSEIWKGNYGVHSPDSFHGVVNSGNFDSLQMPIYERTRTEFDFLAEPIVSARADRATILA